MPHPDEVYKIVNLYSQIRKKIRCDRIGVYHNKNTALRIADSRMATSQGMPTHVCYYEKQGTQYVLQETLVIRGRIRNLD